MFGLKREKALVGLDIGSHAVKAIELRVRKKGKTDFFDKPRKPEQLWLYQMIRIYHNCGRCTDCGACERACPMNIPLRSLLKPMLDETRELFSYESGTSVDEPDPLVTFDLSQDRKKLK